jgi:hypothetical protein
MATTAKLLQAMKIDTETPWYRDWIGRLAIRQCLGTGEHDRGDAIMPCADHLYEAERLTAWLIAEGDEEPK